MQIKIYEGDYDKAKFYSIMGKYFAEPVYKKQLPYIKNKESIVWFLVFEMNKLQGFGSINVLPEKLVFESSFVEDEYRKKGIWKEINKARFEYTKKLDKKIEVITKEEYLKKFWEDNGFEVYRKNGKYYYLRKGEENVKKEES